ncbi:MAG: OadG family protein [Lachnospiraceae bacterium]|jgi:Na+-transporting methylmalonyl-CoA/oxaloacetate decarboxylase gamma subunit|nr:OadG family protein [Lachnospiraceae bacterium]
MSRKKISAFLLAVLTALCLLALGGCSAEPKAADQATADLCFSQSDAVFQEVFSTTSEKGIEEKVSLYQAQKDETNANLYQAWRNAKPDLGQYNSVKSYRVYETEDSSEYLKYYACEITYAFKDRDLHAKVIYDGVSVTSDGAAISAEDLKVAAASMEAEFTYVEKIQKALMNTLLGMGTVFMVLIIISLVIGCFGFGRKIADNRIAAKNAAINAKAKEQAAKALEEEKKVAAVPAAVETEETTDDDELIAVISAAIAAYEAEHADTGYTGGLYVKSIRRVGRA